MDDTVTKPSTFKGSGDTENQQQLLFTETTPVFNAAQIPHNLNSDESLQLESHQIPIENVLQAVDESEIIEEVFGTQDGPEELLYEHQALQTEERDIGRSSDKEVLLPTHGEVSRTGALDPSTQFDEQDETFITHDPPSRDTESPNFTHHYTDNHPLELRPTSNPSPVSTKNVLDQFAALEDDDSIFDQIDNSAVNADYADQQIVETEQNKAQNTNRDSLDQASIDIPDDLDEADFNIDDELDADFAAMEASFNQKLSVSDLQEPTATADKTPKINPYLPPAGSSILSASSGRYLPVNPLEGQSPLGPTQSSTSLFTPAQMSQNNQITQSSNAYTTNFAPPLRPVSTQTRQTSASFVNAKAGYTDPYALPDVLVAKKRARPQPQTLRGAASVPNLKAAAAQLRPPVGQRHASTMGTPSNTGPDTSAHRPISSQSHHAPPAQPLNTQFSGGGLAPMPISQPYSNAATPTLSPPRKNNYEPARRAPVNSGLNNTTLGLSKMLPPQRQLSYGHYAPSNMQQTAQSGASDAVPVGTDKMPFQNQGLHSIPPPRSQTHLPMQQGTQSTLNVHKNQYNPGALPRAPSPLRETRATSIDAVMKGRPSPLQSEFVINSDAAVRVRHESSASSHDSIAPKDVAYSDYIDQQRHAESRMFGDSYAVAEDDIYEAQAIQRGSGPYSPAISSTNSRQLPGTEAVRPQSQPRPILANSTSVRAVAYTARRSFDEKNAAAALEMSRPNSRTADRYASTEPSHSPRQAHAMPYDPEGLLHMRGQKRPPVVSRATSSSQAYQQFPRVLSPVNPSYVHSSEISTNAGTDPAVGHPIACFGFGGKLLTTFPKRIPRFSAQGIMQHQIAGPGPVSITASHELLAAGMLVDFPGPLVHTKSALKQKKADLQLWLAKRIPPGNSQLVDDKTLLYRLLMLLLEFDGTLESPTAKERLITLLYPDIVNLKADDELANFKVVASSIQNTSETDQSQILSSSTLTESAVTRLSELLLRGDKQGALRYASDAKLWAHAFVIASRISPQCWAEAVQEFAATELQSYTESSESLKFLYQSFAGVKPESGKIVPQYTNHVLQNWRKSLTMVLNNRNTGDDLAVTALGNALLEKDSTYAAHFCFLLCARPAIGPKDDPKSLFSMVGQHEISESLPLDRNEAITMSEIYEFCLSLAQPKFLGLPHLLAFKLQRAHLLSDAGHAGPAKKYCEAITNSLKALPKGSNHLHHVLIEQLRDLSERIDQVSGDESSSWIGSKITKPKMDIWGSLEGKFSKFVAGDSDESQPLDANSRGPFAKLAQTPALSRVQSLLDVRNRVAQPTISYNGGYEGEALQPVHIPPQADRNSYPYPEGDSGLQHAGQPNIRPSSSYLPEGNQIPAGQYTPSPFQQPPNMYAPQHVNSVQSQSMQPGHNQYLQPDINPIQAYTTSESASLQTINGPFTNSYAGHHAPSIPYPVVDNMPQACQQGQQTFNPYAPNLNQSYAPERPVISETTATYPQSGYASTAQEPEQASSSAPVQSAVAKSKAQEAKAAVEPPAKADSKPDQAEERKSGWLGGWFGGKKKEATPASDGEVKVHKAKLGEGMSLVYDPVTKKWTNPKGTMPEETKSSAPPPPMMSKRAVTPALQEQKSQPAQAQLETPPSSSPAPSRPAGGPAPGTIGRKLPQADDDLAAMLGTGPAPRRAASGTMGPPSAPAIGSTRAKKSKPAKRYVDVFQGEA